MEDAPAMGRVMVDAWLAAHRGQMPDTLWQKRLEEWTPEVSAAGWACLLAEQEQGEAARELAGLGFSALHIGVLSLNRPARAFYEAMGVRQRQQENAAPEAGNGAKSAVSSR